MYYIIYDKNNGKIIGWQKGAVPILNEDMGYFINDDNNITDKKYNLSTNSIEDITEIDKLKGNI